MNNELKKLFFLWISSLTTLSKNLLILCDVLCDVSYNMIALSFCVS